MKAEIAVLAGVMGIDITKPEQAIFLGETIKGINDLQDFISYCRNRKEGIEYVTRTERLDILATRYKKEQTDLLLSEKIKKGESYAEKLAEKVKQCRNLVEEAGCRWSAVRYEGEKYFEEHELRALKEIGSEPVVIEYSRMHALAEKIHELYADKIRGQASGKIAYKGDERKALNMAKNISRSM